MTDTDASLLAQIRNVQDALEYVKARWSKLSVAAQWIEVSELLGRVVQLQAAALRRSGEALRRLQAENEVLRQNHEDRVFECHELQERLSGAEGTEAGGRSQPLAPTIEEWQPIETAPKDGTVIIGALITDGTVWRVHEMSHSGLAFYTVSGHSVPRMTHWIPMPAQASSLRAASGFRRRGFSGFTLRPCELSQVWAWGWVSRSADR